MITYQNPHILRPLLHFQHGLHNCFLFPADEGSLLQIWKRATPYIHTSVPRSHVQWIRWTSRQFFGLAGAMQFFKKIRDEHTYAKGAVSGSTSADESLRFIDASPHNIFWRLDGLPGFPGDGVRLMPAGTLKMGYSVPHASRMDPPSSLRQNPDKASMDPSLWSFGCVLLEFLLWYYRGPEAIHNFLIRRREEGNADMMAEEGHIFFKKHSYGKTSDVLTLKDCVVEVSQFFIYCYSHALSS